MQGRHAELTKMRESERVKPKSHNICHLEGSQKSGMGSLGEKLCALHLTQMRYIEVVKDYVCLRSTSTSVPLQHAIWSERRIWTFPRLTQAVTVSTIGIVGQSRDKIHRLLSELIIRIICFLNKSAWTSSLVTENRRFAREKFFFAHSSHGTSMTCQLCSGSRTCCLYRKKDFIPSYP